MEFDAFAFYEFFFLFNSFKETFERIGNTNCILMFCPDISCFFFFLFSQMKRYNKEVLGLGSKSYFFLTGQVNFFVQSVYKVVQVLGFCEKPYNPSEKCLRITRNEYI